MLKPRLIGGIVVRSGWAVQSIGFRRYLPLGDPAILAENLNRWGIDEILLLDIAARQHGRGPNLELVRRVARQCFVPLTVGGGIRDVEDVRAVIGAGGDKIAINTAALADPALLRRVADRFGEQCVVASIDVAGNADSGYRLHGGAAASDVFAQMDRYLAEGAGELLITSVERDGSKRGYDLELLRHAAGRIPIPLIAMGGVGHPKHFAEALAIPGVTGAAAANFFAYTEHSALTARGFLRQQGSVLRADTYADYTTHSFAGDGRLAKQPDRDLQRLVYEFYPEERI